ncbi:MAG: MaoC family dehydratase [Burkholderiaceae bacterium]
MSTDTQFWWEDMTPGTVRDLGQHTISAEEIIDFAEQFDPQPFHLSEDGARDSVFGRLCASGWHTCSLAMRLMVRNFLRYSASLGSPGLESVKWLKPVYPADTLRLEHHILESRPMNSRPDVGLVRTVWKMFNQHGEQVLHMEGYGMFRRRTPGTPGVPAAAASTPASPRA